MAPIPAQIVPEKSYKNRSIDPYPYAHGNAVYFAKHKGQSHKTVRDQRAPDHELRCERWAIDELDR
jgi:hypothetical protein